MSVRALLLLLLCLPAPAALAAAAGGRSLDAKLAFEEANRQFAEASSQDDYLKVAALYQAILGKGEHAFESGAVLFNLGNSWFFADEVGRAIAAYRQAARYLPRDPLLENNLALALQAAGQPEPRKTLVDHILFWQHWFSYREKAWLVALLGTLTCLTGLLSLWYGKLWLRIAMVFLLLLLINLTTFGLDVRDYQLTEHGVITADEVTARMGNSESFAPAFNEPLVEGTEFTVLERSEGWVRIRLGNGLDGWLPVDDAVYY